MEHRTKKQGFTLTEVLVAMAILVTVMGSITALFIGSARTVRKGNHLMDSFEVGRSVMGIIEDDLRSTFTAREHGDYHQFYGQPFGFMVVGTLGNGELGRVSYVLTPNINPRTYRAVISEQLNFDDPTTAEDDRLLVRLYQQALNAGLTDAEAQAVIGQIVEAYATIHLGTGITPPRAADIDWTQPDPFAAIPPAFYYDFQVQVTTAALVRYEEPGVTDLNTLTLPDYPDDTLTWPQVNANPDPTASPADWDSVDLDATPVEEALYYELLKAVNPDNEYPDNPIVFTNDLRFRMLEPVFFGYSMKGINTQVIAALIQGKRNELWLRMLANDTTTQPVAFWWEPPVPPNPPDPADTRPLADDYLLADDIAWSVQLLDPSGQPFDFTAITALPVPLDMVNTPTFQYGHAEFGFARFCNTPERIQGMFTNPTPPPDFIWQDVYVNFQESLAADKSTEIAALDEAVAQLYEGTVIDGFKWGSPLAPRIPDLIRVQFWIIAPRDIAGNQDMRHYFEQTMDVPSAYRREINGPVGAR